MKKFIVAIVSSAVLSTTVVAGDIKIGILMGFTGPLESLSPNMAAGAELAMKEVTDSGGLLGNSKVIPVRGDSTCIDASAGTAVAERVITTDKVKAIVGAMCSGNTGAILNNVARPNGIVMISPSATSPGLSLAEDDGLFFRTAPSDARQGEVLRDILMDRGVKSAAMTYTNNDYGKGLADSIQANFENAGGKITVVLSHEDGKGDYSAEVGALAQAGGDVLIVAGYLDQGGKGIIQTALDLGAFETFVLPDGMIGESLPAAIGDALNGSFGSKAASDSDGAAIFSKLVGSAGIPNEVYVAESYDAAALLMLAMQAANSSDSQAIKTKVMTVANAPGEKIMPGELAKGLAILAKGGEVDYVGASDVELIGPGESAGRFGEFEVVNKTFKPVKFR